jgi:cytochrome b subunit of formate dehydrogenase
MEEEMRNIGSKVFFAFTILVMIAMIIGGIFIVSSALNNPEAIGEWAGKIIKGVQEGAK